jgi:hypothetical protein
MCVYIIIPVYTTVIHDSSSVIYTNILFERLSNLSSQIILSHIHLRKKLQKKMVIAYSSFFDSKHTFCLAKVKKQDKTLETTILQQIYCTVLLSSFNLQKKNNYFVGNYFAVLQYLFRHKLTQFVIIFILYFVNIFFICWKLNTALTHQKTKTIIINFIQIFHPFWSS